MSRLIVRSRVDADGVLRIVVPVGVTEADREMQVTIESLSSRPDEQTQYVAWLESIAGSWQGDFERPVPGEFEKRDAL